MRVDAAALPRACGLCTFFQASTRLCHRHAPSPVRGALELAYWPQVASSDRCGSGAEYTEGATMPVRCGQCVHWHQPDGKLPVPPYGKGRSNEGGNKRIARDTRPPRPPKLRVVGRFASRTLTSAGFTAPTFINADLSQATLIEADLSGANLRRVYLTGAYLTGAYLTGANLSDAYLSGVRGVTQEQLDQACGTGTTLPDGLALKPCPPR